MWSHICSAVLGFGSVVYEECKIASQSLPHGDIDVVAGKVDEESGGIDLTTAFGVKVVKSEGCVKLSNPIGVSAKTRKTLPTKPVSTFKEGS